MALSRAAAPGRSSDRGKSNAAIRRPTPDPGQLAPAHPRPAPGVPAPGSLAPAASRGRAGSPRPRPRSASPGCCLYGREPQCPGAQPAVLGLAPVRITGLFHLIRLSRCWGRAVGVNGEWFRPSPIHIHAWEVGWAGGPGGLGMGGLAPRVGSVCASGAPQAPGVPRAPPGWPGELGGLGGEVLGELGCWAGGTGGRCGSEVYVWYAQFD